MKFENKHKLDNGFLYFWFEPSWKEMIQKKRKKEVEKDFVLQKLRHFDNEAQIIYSPNGAPSLSKEIKIDDVLYANISISHSEGWFAFYFSKTNEGVDIQLFKNRMKNALYFFMNDSEIARFSSTTDFHLVWGAKEAFYKKIQGNLENAKEELEILKIDYQNKQIELLHDNNLKTLSFQLNEELFLVWTT